MIIQQVYMQQHDVSAHAVDACPRMLLALARLLGHMSSVVVNSRHEYAQPPAMQP